VVVNPLQLERLGSALAGRYAIEREIGRGGMATVYLADDLKHRRKVALKVLKPELGSWLGADRFTREIQAAAALNHPHILALYDSGTADGLLFYVMPYVKGDPSGRSFPGRGSFPSRKQSASHARSPPRWNTLTLGD
jgi:serine/threonine protein kinase